MEDTYLTISKPSEGLYKDKGSKFLSFAYHVESVEQVNEILAKMQKEYYDARHICYAYMLGYKRLEYRANDNGEPSSTAGKPILGQINSANLTDILIVVVRYFGGTLLGTSGLIQAYKTAAYEAIQANEIEERVVEERCLITCQYNTLNLVMRIIKENNLTITSQVMELDCKLYVNIRLTLLDVIREKIGKIDFVTFEVL